MRVPASLLAALLVAGVAEGAATLAITNVTVIDVEDGQTRAAQTVVVEDGRIRSIEQTQRALVPPGATIVDGKGRFLLPGFWDMHVHSHRDRRWTYHYPLFVAHGITGVRDAGTHLSSALEWIDAVKGNPLAPTVVWGSPPLDGPSPILSFGLALESEAATDEIAGLIRRSGFDFIKTYDRLPPATYRALAHAAKRENLRIEGHVPLAMSPAEAVAAGHAVIDHLTLVVESCVPGALEHVHARVAADPDGADSMALLMDPALTRLLDGYDADSCRKLFTEFAEHRVWQVPTLVQLRGFVQPEEAARLAAARTAETTPTLLAEWQSAASESDKATLAAGVAMFRRQLALLRPMQDAGVRLMVGTDTSSEPWVFAGSSVHDEMELFVVAGLSPLEALQAATLNPLQYAGRARKGRAVAVGEVADLVLLDADPRIDIARTRAIRAVILRGRLFDRDALEDLRRQANAAASRDGRLQ
jgi:imidazolonepropionase-like amidohydrolase